MFSIYGILISLGIFCALLIAESLVEKQEKDTLWELSFWGIIGGLVGARLYHVIDYFWLYSKNPILILDLRNGGLGIWGAIAGGFITAIIYLKLHKKSVLKWFDVAAVVFPLAQSVGRFGNFFNQELYGKATTLPWGIYINKTAQYHHPLFAYEAILNLCLFTTLYCCYKKYSGKVKPGIFFAAYLAGYSLIRFSLEFLRINPWTVFGLNIAQTISILVFIYAIYFIGPWWFRTKK